MKKSYWLLGAGFLFAGVFAYYQTRTEPQANTITDRFPAQESGYCIALRGNGELEPAHWGALARTIEQLGLPEAMAGGSSATVSMFLTEAVAAHPLVASQAEDVQKERASLLLKSFLGFFTELQKTKSWQDVKGLYGTFEKTENLSTLQKIGLLIQKGQTQAAIQTIQKAVELGVMDLQTAQPLLSSLGSANLKKAHFYWQQLMETVSVFGKFDAAGDDNLFFRTGIVSFEKAAETFGKVAAFYSVPDQDKKQIQTWQTFFDACGPDSKGLTWSEITQRNSKCETVFHNLFINHYDKSTTALSPENFKIGREIHMYPTTTVLTGTAAQDYKAALKQYHQNMDPKFGKNFRIKNQEEVRFGYWGHPEKLQKISQSLDSTDEKSRRFLPLGLTTWKEVLSLSPAEPGLSPLKEFSNQGQSYVSAGGWSDLHPILVLKAAGCDHVVYLTRQGGESLFAQGVAKRLLNLERDWALLASGDAKVKRLNDEGDRIDQTSLWSRLYNLGNPSSSVNRSLEKTSAILCTNWNAFEVQKQFVPLIEDSYRSSFWINKNFNSSAISNLKPVLQAKKPGCSP